ncbi:hypothetical protein JCM9533A_04580 [Catenuloplanes niger JCM 9533]
MCVLCLPVGGEGGHPAGLLGTPLGARVLTCHQTGPKARGKRLGDKPPGDKQPGDMLPRHGRPARSAFPAYPGGLF